jgi:hypothetical protein
MVRTGVFHYRMCFADLDDTLLFSCNFPIEIEGFQRESRPVTETPRC